MKIDFNIITEQITKYPITYQRQRIVEGLGFSEPKWFFYKPVLDNGNDQSCWVKVRKSELKGLEAIYQLEFVKGVKYDD